MRSVGEIAHDLPHAARPCKAFRPPGLFGEEILQNPGSPGHQRIDCSPVSSLTSSTAFAHPFASPAASSERARASAAWSRSRADC
jgi:hypothetical protein